MFGYLAQAVISARSQRSMFASAYGPLLSRDRTFTHITGWPCAAFIIRAILAARPMFEPAATSAVSFVPSAITQQPRNPLRVIALAAL